MAVDPHYSIDDGGFKLDRYVMAQHDCYADALRELRQGRKTHHWMWFIFPQIAGLGISHMSQMYAIRSTAEAEAYLRHPLLGPRLTECTEAVLSHQNLTAAQIFDFPDDVKLRSSMTLFASVSPEGSVFHRVLNHFFHGEADGRTLDIVDAERMHL